MTDLTMFAVALTMLLAFGCGVATGWRSSPGRYTASRKQWRRERLSIDLRRNRRRS